MGKMEQTLKSEITRPAKKQRRATYLPLAREVRPLKRTVAALRKTVAVLARLAAELQAERMAERAKVAAAPEEVKASRISPLVIQKLRRRLGDRHGSFIFSAGSERHDKTGGNVAPGRAYSDRRQSILIVASA